MDKNKHMIKCGIYRDKGVPYTFDNDDGRRAAASRQCKLYTEIFDTMQARSIGLLLTGGSGSGKTFLGGCIANALALTGVTACVIDFKQAANRIENAEPSKADILMNELFDSGVLVIDNLETVNDGYGLFISLIEKRISHRKPIIALTALESDDVENANDTRLARLYDLLYGACILINL